MIYVSSDDVRALLNVERKFEGYPEENHQNSEDMEYFPSYEEFPVGLEHFSQTDLFDHTVEILTNFFKVGTLENTLCAGFVHLCLFVSLVC